MSSDHKGIMLIVFGMLIFSFQDALIKGLSTEASLLQIFVLRGVLGILFLSVFLKFTKRPISFRSKQPLIAITRSLMFPISFLCFYLAVAAMPIAEASALFFVSPIFMTILSKVILKNKVGIHRIGAIIIGFVGILLIIKPEFNNFNWVMILPIITAFCYSLSMILTILTKESDSVFEQTSHVYIGSILVGMTVYLIFGRYGNHYNNNPSLSYLLREWDFDNIILISKILMISIFGTVGIFCLINAYRISVASIIAPFEYTIIIYALVIGYLLFDEILDYTSLIGITLIVLSGLYILIREKPRKTQIVTKTSLRK